MDRMHHTGLSPLSDLEDYEFAEGSPDIRGWVVIDETGQEIGEVDDLLVDTTSHEALYAVVDLDDGEDAEVPLALVTLDVDDEAVRLTQPLATGEAAHDTAFEAPAAAEFVDRAAPADRSGDTAVGATRLDGEGRPREEDRPRETPKRGRRPGSNRKP